MHRINKRLRAYTIVEMIVVMLISAVTMTIAYKGYSIFQNLFYSFRENGKQLSTTVLFNRMMEEDVNRAEFVYKTPEGISCQFSDKTVVYRFTDDYLLRDYLVSDTFYIQPIKTQLFFQKEEQQAMDGLVDELTFSGIVKEDTLYFSFTKQYAADVLMTADKKKRF